MHLATIIGRATATVKHSTLSGWKLAIAQPLDAAGDADGIPLLVIDNLGSGRGDRVVISSDGASLRELMGSNNSPARWAVIGLADE